METRNTSIVNHEFSTEDRLRERKKMLHLAQTPPIQKLEVVGFSSAPISHQNFLKHFEEKIWPVMSQRDHFMTKASALHTMLDRALYDDEEEKERWMTEKNEAEKELQKLSTSPVWQADVKKWAGLAQEALPGTNKDQMNSIDLISSNLVLWARRTWEDIELGEFTEKEQPWLERLTEISTLISNLSNTSELVPKLGPTEKAINDTVQGFFAGEITFEKAWQKIESLQPEGRTAHGQDVATKGRALLQEAAVLRTKLAQSKGYRTWAAYVMAQQARHYAPGYKTAEEKISFLKRLLHVTKNPYERFLKKRITALQAQKQEGTEELSLDTLRRSQLSLLQLEDDTIVRDYFPRSKVEGVWQKTMLESGFESWALNCISLDCFPRAKKYTHAYMNNVSSHAPKTFSIDAKTLDVKAPPVSKEQWHDAAIYIVQNFRDDGPDAWTTAWHEGGHAMDYIHQEDVLGFGAAYGFVETHSMTMERFFQDEEFLLETANAGITDESRKLSREKAREFIRNSRMNSLVQFRTQAAYALYDLQLWNQEYTDATSFVDTATRIFGELILDASLAKGFDINGIDWRMSSFATGHFYEGGVRYFGYIVADMAAQMTAEYMWDHFEKTTGRRTLLYQPGIAPLLKERYYRNGFLKEFPKPVEELTQKTFDPEAMVAGLVKAVEAL